MNIAVIFGGESCEHDISIITGVQLLSKIDEYLYNIMPIYIDKNGRWWTGESLKDIDNYPKFLNKLTEVCMTSNDNNLYIKKGKKLKLLKSIDFAFVCMHGQRGEDGSVAGLMELCKVPYSSSSILSSAIAMDKVAFKLFLDSLNIRNIKYTYILKNDYIKDEAKEKQKIIDLEMPVIVKPSRQGSSIGIKICRMIEDLDACLADCFKYDDRLLVEKYVDIKKEVNIALFRYKDEIIFSDTEEPKYNSEILGFDEKYRNNSGGFETIKRVMPAEIAMEDEEYIKLQAKKVYDVMDMFGVVRFDFIVDFDDNIYLNEVNSIPGSMANYLFASKIKYSKLIESIILSGLIRKESSDKLIKTFESKVLENGFDGFKK